MIETLLEVLGVGLIVLGVGVAAITVYGMSRLRGLFIRLQAASKAAMLGAVAILAASIGSGDGAIVARAIAVALFLLLTTPVAAHVIAEAAYKRELEPTEDGDEPRDGPRLPAATLDRPQRPGSGP